MITQLQYLSDDSIASDVILRVDDNTIETVTYRETGIWHDGSPMDDSKCDGAIYIKKGGSFFVDSEFLYEGNINVIRFGADKSGATDSTSAINNAFSMAYKLYKSFDSSGDTGYFGWFEPIVRFPTGLYKCGTITMPPRVKIVGSGQVTFVSNIGTADTPSGNFVDNQVINFEIENCTFLNYETVFKIPTNNIDFSFLTFRKCNVAKCGTFVDTVSFSLSRSTHILFDRCRSGYGVEKFCKIYTDKATFKNNWFYQNSSSKLLYIDSLAEFQSNVWVPTTVASSARAWIEFEATDIVRGLSFNSERFGGESGSMAVVEVGDINKEGHTSTLKNIGITFNSCFICSANPYPSEIEGSQKCVVVMKYPSTTNRSLDFVKFNGCLLAPELLCGVFAYNWADMSRLSDKFNIEYDYASAISLMCQPNLKTKYASDNLKEYIISPLLQKSNTGVTKDGKLIPAIGTSTSGTFKVSFKIMQAAESESYSLLSPQCYMVILCGNGSTLYGSGNYNYAYSSVYMLHLSGYHEISAKIKLVPVKISGSWGAVDTAQSNADIISVYWGTGDTGNADFDVVGYPPDRTLRDITIKFGTNMYKGWAVIKPLFDFDMRN